MVLVYLLSVIYFYLPGAIANIGANLSRFISPFKEMSTPIDRGFVWKGHRLIGEHKTWGGFLCGMVFGVAYGSLKIFVFDRYWFGDVFLHLDAYRGLLLVFLLSFGALSGDIVKSVIKRVSGIAPHSAWIPFDEIDHTVMAMLLVKVFFDVEWILVFWVVCIYFVLHLITNIIGFKLRIKRVPY